MNLNLFLIIVNKNSLTHRWRRGLMMCWWMWVVVGHPTSSADISLLMALLLLWQWRNTMSIQLNRTNSSFLLDDGRSVVYSVHSLLHCCILSSAWNWVQATTERPSQNKSNFFSPSQQCHRHHIIIIIIPFARVYSLSLYSRWWWHDGWWQCIHRTMACVEGHCKCTMQSYK